MQHQKAKHFKCNQCPRRLNTAGGLAVHIQQVHKLEVDQLPKIDNALPGRDGYEVEIFGMEGIPAPDVADYKRRKEVELGLSAGTITQPQAKRPKIENKIFTQAELKAQLEAHKALMGAPDNVPKFVTDESSSAAVYNAEPQTYSAPSAPLQPPVPIPGMPPFPPGGFPPPGLVGAPPFPPMMPGMPFGGPPPPGFPGFPPPPGMGGPPPPGGGMPPFAPAGMSGPPPMGQFSSQPGGPSQMAPTNTDQHISAPPPISHSPTRPKSPPRVYPPSNYTNPAPKAGTKLTWNDANYSPEEIRVRSEPMYQPQPESDLSGEGTRGTKRARAEDFL